MAIHIRRREFIVALGGAASTWPLAARAQQLTTPLVGLISGRSLEADAPYLAAIRQGLSDAGYIENKNVAMEFRWANGQYEQLPALAADLIHRQVVLIVAIGTIASKSAARAAHMRTPVVFGMGDDPVKEGVVAQINRPGGNITGVSNSNAVLAAKTLGLLHDLTPKADTVAVLVNPNNSDTESQLGDMQAATRITRQRLVVLRAGTERDIDAAFANLVAEQAGALLIETDSFFLTRFGQLVSLAARYAVPTAYASRQFVEAGGLISYAPSQIDGYRQVGVYAGRILKGEKPANLPVLLPTKFELVINLKTARTIGIEIPPTLLTLATGVIE
jgi:putative tryptophan/tyrosine transport system substrate-binding protein